MTNIEIEEVGLEDLPKGLLDRLANDKKFAADVEELFRQAKVGKKRDAWLAARAFCGNPRCECAHDWGVPCEHFENGEHPFGRCGCCGWAQSQHTKQYRKFIAAHLKKYEDYGT